MVQASVWLRSVLVLAGLSVMVLHGAGHHGFVKLAGDDPKIYKGG